MRAIYPLIFILFVLVTGCFRSPVTTAWKAPHIQPGNFQRIMVTSILDTDDSTRKSVEATYSTALRKMGYETVGYMETIGKGSLSDLSEEDTYLQLCNKGIDAVIVITIADRVKEKELKMGKAFNDPSGYYYNRIWNLKNIQAALGDSTVINKDYYWESILFNLLTLEPECTVVLQTNGDVGETAITNATNAILRKMVKEGVLQTGTKPLKVF